MKTIISILKNLRKGNYWSRTKLFFLTRIAGASSYFTGLGFKLIAETSFQDGYFSYSGNLANIMLAGVLTAVVLILWSHLQFLNNQNIQEHVDTNTIECVDLRAANVLVNNNFRLFPNNRWNSELLDVVDSQEHLIL
ncbi:hypothetical protein [Coxiella-like endosymbiont]|uniref:hypothetical protein n=1 Tax=Coxiella-like endosymbiont TaxID=1592897 RepID=UPI00272CBE6B|nr:hypothetical protein [Coxiella-like endosymbiont]